MPLKEGLSVCIITLNEEQAIQRCLESVSFADEIILMDSFSTDATCRIARKAGVRVYQHKFSSYAEQKNLCMKKAKYSWLLFIDADEALSYELQEEIQHLLRGKPKKEGYRIPRIAYYLNRWIRFSGWYPDLSVRLVQNGRGEFRGGIVHEKLHVEGEIGRLKSNIHHYSYGSISEHLERINLYSSLIAEEKFKKGYRSSVTWAVLKSFSKFFITYFWKLGFLDGRAGFVIAAFGAFYNFQKYIKIWEMKRAELRSEFRKP